MESKGQISLDFILAALFFIAAFQIILSMSQNLEQSELGIALQNQMDVIAENISAKVSQKMLLEGTGAESSFSFSIPLIVSPGRPSQGCEVEIDSAIGYERILVYHPTKLAAKAVPPEPGSKIVELKIANPAPAIGKADFKCGYSYNCVFTPANPPNPASWSCSEA